MGTLISVLGVPEHQIYEYVNSYAKIYPNMTKLFTFHKPIKVRIAGYEGRGTKQSKPRVGSNDEPRVVLDSLRRTKTRLSDIVVSNQFDMFCTFTFNCNACPANRAGEKCKNKPCICGQETCKRFDINFCKQRMGKWLDNQNQHVGKFKYLIVPEFHADHKAIHFHALFKDYKGELLDEGKTNQSGRSLFTLAEYHFGWADAVVIPTEDVPKVGSYVKKYITKDMPQFNNKKRYWVSHNLIRPKKIKNPIVFPYQEKQFTKEYEMQGVTLKMSDTQVDLIAAQRGKLYNSVHE